jgi:hypothetical protein
MRRFDADYKPNMKEKTPPCTDLSASKAIDGLHSKLWQATFAAGRGELW